MRTVVRRLNQREQLMLKEFIDRRTEAAAKLQQASEDLQRVMELTSPNFGAPGGGYDQGTGEFYVDLPDTPPAPPPADRPPLQLAEEG